MSRGFLASKQTMTDLRLFGAEGARGERPVERQNKA